MVLNVLHYRTDAEGPAMSAIEKQPKSGIMSVALRPMAEADIPQTTEIERDSFPTLFPPTSFRRELGNGNASYIVAWSRDDTTSDGPAYSPNRSTGTEARPLMGRLFNSARSILSKRDTAWQPGDHFVTGFLGTWYMMDEAHVVSVGVRRNYRRQGIGELLLIGAIEQAYRRHSRVVTLEVRVSNHIAQSLYRKYGFEERGRRKSYYTDNREDAVIMTTRPISVPHYPDEFRGLVIEHERRWGKAERRLP